MNALQREIAIRESGFRCAVTALAYGRNYFDIEHTLHPLNRLTVDHCDGRRTVKGIKVDEESDNISVISGEAHWFKDNTGRDAQITWLKRKIAELEATYPLAAPSVPDARMRVGHIRSVLRFLEDGNDLKAYLQKHIEERGPFSGAYDRAKEQERGVDAPARAAKKKASRHAAYTRAKKKAGGTPLSRKKPKPASPAGKPPGMTTKDYEQSLRPNFNASRP